MDASIHEIEDILVATLIQLIVIILAARLAGNAARAMRQPRAVGEIVAGLLLGPSLFGHLLPDLSAVVFSSVAAAPMLILSQIGLILLMFQIGSDFEFGHLRAAQNKKAVACIAIASVGVPLCLGLLIGWKTAPLLAPGVDALTYSLFVSVALAITALPILGRILREYSLTRTETGVIAISAAAVNDVVGWVLLAGVAAYASTGFSLASSGLQIAGIAAFAAVLAFAGRRMADWLVRSFPVENGQLPPDLMAIVIVLIFVAGACTYALGIFTIFGGFLLGLLFHRHHAFVEAWRDRIGQFVLVFFLPIFFTYTGLRTNVLGLTTAEDWMWCAIIFTAAVAGKVAPVYLAARISGLAPSQSTILGILLNTRALMELIVLNIGLSLGFIPPNVFTMLVIMAVGTTIMTGPLLQLVLPRTGHSVKVLAEA